MLIVQADVLGRGVADLRIRGGRVAAIGELTPEPAERVIDARVGALLPGLHDHHLHLLAYAASLNSLRCGPPAMHSEDELIAALRGQARRSPTVWLRGYGYHESVAGDIDRAWLDRWVPDTPVRIQHRSGRLWIVNSAGIERLMQASDRRRRGPPGLDGLASGRLYDQDEVVQEILGQTLPDVAAASRRLARCGVTGITDMTPRNDRASVALFARLQAQGQLLQRVQMAGTLELKARDVPPDAEGRLSIGATKIHLHESALPDFGSLCEIIERSHDSGRSVAIHCVSETELVFALAALRESGALAGDRIEHASVTPPALLEQLRALRLWVVTQPNFVAERGDAYLQDMAPAEHPWLYRGRSFLAGGIPLAGGTDAPFGEADPWYAIRAATRRETASGRPLGKVEALSPSQALALFLGAPEKPHEPRKIRPGAVADLCLLDRPWSQAADALSADCVRATLRNGELIYDGIDQAPLEGPAR